MKRESMAGLVAFASGATFGFGLALGGMTAPRRVLGFLDVFGDWDPTLVFVMFGAVAVHFLATRVILRRSAPLFADEFALPRGRRVDRRLLGGAALFGIGWGLSGYCPGPSVVSLPSALPSVLVFVGAMALGMFFTARLSSAQPSDDAARELAGRPVGR